MSTSDSLNTESPQLTDADENQARIKGAEIPVRLPLFVGVTGHGDLTDDSIELLEKSVRELFDRLHTAYPYTPLKLLSTLAPGADQLVARVALSLNAALDDPNDAVRKIGLIFPIPMPLETYAAVLESESARTLNHASGPSGIDPVEEFKRLAAQAEASFVVPHHDHHHMRRGESLVHGYSDKLEVPVSDDSLYRQTSAYIAHNCTILIALWDGKENPVNPSQTELAVRHKLHGSMYRFIGHSSVVATEELFNYLEADAGGIVYHIKAVRSGNHTSSSDLLRMKVIGENRKVGEPFPLRFRKMKLDDMAIDCGDPQSEAGMDPAAITSAQNIDKFNRRAFYMQTQRESAEQIAKSLDWLMPDALAAKLTPFQLDLRRCFAVADAMALQHKNKATKKFTVLLRFGFVAGLAFGLAHLPHAEPFLCLVLLIYAGATVLLEFFRRKARKEQDQDWFQDCRALAEGMRIQFFWNISGVHLPAGSCYFRKIRGEIDWIRSGIDAWDVLSVCERGATSEGESPVSKENLALVQERWIQDQGKWMINSARKERAKMEEKERKVFHTLRGTVITAGVFGGIVALSLVANLVCQFMPEKVDSYVAIALGILIFVLHVVAISAGLIHLAADRLAHHQHTKQYAETGEYLTRANWLLSQLIAQNTPASRTTAQRVLEQVGRETLAENSDWLMIHRERPLEAEGA